MENILITTIISNDKEEFLAINEIFQKIKFLKVLKNKSYLSIEDLYLNLKPDILIFLENNKKQNFNIEFLKQKKIPSIFLVDNSDVYEESFDEKFYPFKILKKPFNYQELLDTIYLLGKKIEEGFYKKLIIEGYTFQPSLKMLVGEDGKKITLTDKETLILEYFYKNKNKVLNKELLLLNIWGYKENITTHTLETHIYRLRKKLSSNHIKSKVILSKNNGYVFKS